MPRDSIAWGNGGRRKVGETNRPADQRQCCFRHLGSSVQAPSRCSDKDICQFATGHSDARGIAGHDRGQLQPRSVRSCNSTISELHQCTKCGHDGYGHADRLVLHSGRTTPRSGGLGRRPRAPRPLGTLPTPLSAGNPTPTGGASLPPPCRSQSRSTSAGLRRYRR